MRRIAALVLLVSVAMLTSPTAASVPHLINYQGILTDSGGTPITGAHSLTFSVYPDSGQATPAYWSETHAGVELDNGLFNVILGGVVALEDSLFDGENLWMGIAVDAGQEMTPRIRIVSAPWALRAAASDSAGTVDWSGVAGVPAGFADGVDDVGGAGDGYSLDAADGSPVDALYVDDTGAVGVGTTSPTDLLDVRVPSGSSDGLSISHPTSYSGYPTLSFKIGGERIARLFSHQVGRHLLLETEPGKGYIQLYPEGALMMMVTPDGVGVNNSEPSEMLDVAGNVKATAFLGDGSGLTGVVTTETDPTVLASVKDGVDWSEVTGIPSDLADGDNVLTEADVDAFADNNGYLTTETDPTVPDSIKDGIDWSELTGVPAGFADGVDDVGGAGDGYSLDAADGSPTDALYVDNEGNVGVGTATPDGQLEISESDTGVAVSLTGYAEDLAPADADLARIDFRTNFNLAGGYANRASILARTTDLDYEPSAALRFYTSYRNEDVTEKMVIMPDGAVGIGTTNPTEKLHVNGNLKVDGDVVMNTVTRYYSVSGEAFLPRFQDTPCQRLPGQLFPNSPVGTPSTWFASVTLPHGATVTEVKWFVFDNWASDDARLQLVRHDLSLFTDDFMVEVETAGAVDSIREFIESTVAYATIDNQNSSYSLVITVPGTGSPSSFTLLSVRITYTIDQPLP